MDFTSEQELLRQTVRRACERHHGPDVVRKLENDPVGYSTALWDQLAELGVLGLVIDEQHGGSGMTMLEAAIVYEEFGRALVTSPHFAGCVLAAGLIGRIGSADLQQQWLPALASGSSIVTVAWLEPDGGYGEAGVQLIAKPDGDGWRLTGTKLHVPFAQAANAMLVLVRVEDDVAAVLVEPTAPGVSLEQQLTVAGDAQFLVRFDDVMVDGSAVVGRGDDVWDAWHRTMLDGAILLAAQAVGGARAALDLAVDYAKTREQFDKPLGAFQAIAHYLSDAATRVDGAQTLAWQAAWARSEGRAVESLAPMAKGFACRTFRDVTGTAVQIFGGVGFTVEFDIQLYFRRAKSLQLNYWDDRYLDELIAQQILD